MESNELCLIINSQKKKNEIALLEDGKLIQYDTTEGLPPFTCGDIILAKVSKLQPSLNACFVATGNGKDGFLHYPDLGPDVRSVNKYLRKVLRTRTDEEIPPITIDEPMIDKHGQMEGVMERNQIVLVQVTKEPIKTKGPRLSTELSFAGRYIVLIPFADKISISQKIRSNAEKKRLKRAVESVKPEGFGVIVRTVAQDRNMADFDADMKDLVQKWEETIRQVRKTSRSLNHLPKRVFNEDNRMFTMIRDTMNDNYSIFVNNKETFHDVRDYVGIISPKKDDSSAPKVSHYRGMMPIFEKFRVDRQIQALFRKNAIISGSGGAYLVIEHTEALHSIDVNSGSKYVKGNQEENALRVNKHAAQEIARQLRLRDLGGIIVIDFVDMRNRDNKKQLYEYMKECMKSDPAKHKILSLSLFGLMQITRQRVRPEQSVAVARLDHENVSIDQFKDKLEDEIRMIVKQKKVKNLNLHLNPLVHSFLKKGFPSTILKWSIKYKCWIKAHRRHRYSLFDYSFKKKKTKIDSA